MPCTSHSNTLISNLLNLVDSHLVECAASVRCDDNVDSAIHYHLSSGGNKIRAKLTLESCLRLGVHQNDAVVMAAAIECLHNASLVHDDLIDGDEYRREKRAVWHKYNADIAICAGDMLIARAFGILSYLTQETKIGACLRMMREVTETTIEGQSADINTQTWQNLSTTEYCDTVALKSVPLLQICMAMPLHYAGIRINEHMLYNVFNPFASAYQILDDIEDWQQDHARERCNYLSLLSKDFSEYHDADVYRVAFDDVETLLANSECNESQLPSELIGLMAPFTLRLKLKMQALQREQSYD